MAEPTPQEVLMLALINRARLDPAGEAARYGIDLNEGLAGGTISAASKQPLAFSDPLLTSADAHSQAMIDNDYFAHDDPNTGSTPQSRANAAGYSGGVGENIAWRGSTGPIDGTQMIFAEHQDLFVDTGVGGRGHRLNILDDRYQQVGVGQVLGLFTSGGTTYNASMITQDFGIPGASGQFLTGIVYNDNDANASYSVGEGRAGVSISGGAMTGTAGAYARTIGSGAQSITFSGGGLAAAVTVTAVIAAGKNAMVDLVGMSTIETSVSLTAVAGVTKIIGFGNLGLTLTGSGADDTIVSAKGNDALNGAAGFDTAVYSGNQSAYTVTNSNGTVTVAGPDGTDTLTGIEKLQFKDASLVLNLAQPLKQTSDFDGNGHDDSLWLRDDGTVSIWDNGLPGNAHFVGGGVPSDWHVAGKGDFDGNGRDDILWHRDNGAVSVWDNGLMGGAHIIADAGVVPTSWHIAGTGDFDGNGHDDIVWYRDNGTVSIWDNGQIGGAHVVANAGVVPTSWHIAGTGDFDGNGHDDFLWRNDNGAVSIWDNGQIGGAHIVANAGVVANSWHIAGTGDFDGNGHDDILWRNDNGAVSIWDNGQIGGAHIVAGAGVVPNSWHIAGTGDFDDNAHSDILWRHDNGTVSIWDNGQIGNAHVIAAIPNDWHIV